MRYEDVWAALLAAEVPFVVVGGAAVVLHGHLRMTADLDLVVRTESGPLRLAVEVLTALGFGPRLPVPALDFADDAKRAQWIAERGLTVFTMIHDDEALEVDLFAESPLPFDQLLDGSVGVDVNGTVVQIASIPHLIAMKRIAGRPQDLLDIAALEALAR